MDNLANIGDQIQRALADSMRGQGINLFEGPTQVSVQHSSGAQAQTATGLNPLNPFSFLFNVGNNSGVQTESK